MAVDDQDFDHDGTTVGQRLRRAREEREMSLDEVAAQTRIPTRHLRAIEDSRWEELPAVTYTVGFGRAYASAVGLNGPEIGRELREQLAGSPKPPGLSEYSDPPDPARVPSRSIAWIAALLAVGLVVGYLVWRAQIGGDDIPQQDPPPEQTEQVANTGPTALAPAAQPQDLAGQQVTLIAAEPVWFRVNDRAAGNRRLIERVVAAGERYQVPRNAARPVIRTQRPQVLRVMIGGQEVGRLGQQEGRVADVSLLANDLAQSIRSRGQSGAPAPSPGFGPGPTQPARPESQQSNGFRPLL